MDDVPSSPDELVTRVEDLFTLPDIYVKVKALIDDPESSIGDIGAVVALDPGISARLLKFSNSAFYGLSRKIETVSHAVNILGTQTVHDIVLATSVANVFAGISSAFMDMEAFWGGSIYRAVAARLLAIECRLLESERAFVQGLLSDVGHLVMYQEIPEIAQAARHKVELSGAEPAAAERELLGYDYAQVGGALLRLWQLPQSLTDTVLYHAQPSQAQAFQRETCIVHIAAHIGAAVDSQLDVADWDLSIDPVAWQTTGLTPDIYPALKDAADESVSEAKDLFR